MTLADGFNLGQYRIVACIGLAGPIDGRHPAAADAGDDLVLAQSESVG